ncbi:lipopolysaccharide biosynthesis protein [Devosia sp. SL43]|uniref:lipopolysaccharide biosynthesis protein n=1 Tax=Devosia sp. SL43 TaxID=2806348 RepID=UPI001F18C53C|nr:hypothetical protein [Devosia sp. SL43]UJW84816.1 hypothetical protein IM737_15520 [Devosia sp. SL43]
MNDRHASLYLVSRLAAAVLNIVSVAVFTRLATPDVYGGYLVGFATGFVVFGTAFQWLLHAHFGVYQPQQAARLAGALAALLGVAGAAVAPFLVIATILSWLDVGAAIGIAVLVAGFVVQIGAVEVGRARLMVHEVTAAGLLRGVLMLVFGTLALLITQSAPALLAAVGLAQIVAALPVLLTLRRGGFARPTRADLESIVRYGGPLIIALGVTALALNTDRLVLERIAGAAAVAHYGAMSDVVRQGFVVLGEAIAAAYLSQAKAMSPTNPSRTVALRRAFTTLWTIILFGTLGWLLLGETLLGALLAPGYVDEVHAVLPALVLGTACLVLRAYYFGQAIYFAGSARREVLASLAMLGVAAAGALLLIPAWGIGGAALSFALGQVAALAVFLIADRHTRVMPIDWRKAAEATAWSAVTGAVGLMALLLAGWWLVLLVLAISSIWLALRWNLFDIRALLGQMAPSSRRQ